MEEGKEGKVRLPEFQPSVVSLVPDREVLTAKILIF